MEAGGAVVFGKHEGDPCLPISHLHPSLPRYEYAICFFKKKFRKDLTVNQIVSDIYGKQQFQTPSVYV